MIEWESIAQPMHYIVELDAPLTERRERGKLVQGDENANAFVLEIYQRKGVPADLTGCTVTLNFVRPDNLVVPPITAAINGNVATATLTETCYRVSGMYGALITLTKDGTERTILKTIGDMISTENSGMVDEEGVFPTPEEILQTLQVLETAIQNANNAAGTANVAASSANTAAGRANSAASAIENLTASATGLEAGSAPTVGFNGKNFAFGIPKGDKGDKGDPGTIENMTITSIAGLPEALASVDAVMLGGKAPEYYLPAVQLLDNPDFAIAQAGYNGLHGNTLYAADRWETGRAIIEKVKHGLSFAWNGADSVNGYIFQAAAIDATVGKSYTFAARINGEIYIFPITFKSDVTDEFGERKNDVAMRYTVNEDSVEFTIYTYTTTAKVIEWAALYEGTYTAETLPPFVPRPYAVELAECQRYFRKSWEGNLGPNGAISFSHLNATTYSYPLVNWEIKMRVPPTIKLYSWDGGEGHIRNWTDGVDVSDIEASYISEKGFGLSVMSGETLKVGNLYAFHYTACADL